ncbi:MAG TPA: prepilin-type N-terminal cleavage/methylation domain-containing protein [Verrucomicrobiae bacterium]|nr:prepilin-type N-terminal cleavage/methylation domain-containing protein [Verrucomicrobiae bacterium]
MPTFGFKFRYARLIGDRDGFTLIELLIAIVLLTVGLLGTAALTTGVIRGNVTGKHLTTATAIAQSCFEENRRVGYANAGAVPAGGSNSCVAGSATVTAGGHSFTRNLTIDASVSHIKTLTVTVSWSEGAVGAKSITLRTIVAAS